MTNRELAIRVALTFVVYYSLGWLVANVTGYPDALLGQIVVGLVIGVVGQFMANGTAKAILR